MKSMKEEPSLDVQIYIVEYNFIQNKKYINIGLITVKLTPYERMNQPKNSSLSLTQEMD